MPEESQLASFYPPDYHSLGRQGLLTRIRYDMRIKRLQPLLRGDGAILDFGCGDGSFLVQAAARMPNRKLVGYEIGERREIHELAAGAVTVVRGSLADLLDVLPACQVITMNHVIEHLPDPVHILTQLRRRMAQNGVLEGQTPASASLEQRVFGRRWSGYHAPRHTVVFSMAGLRQALLRAGFVGVEVRGAFNPAGLAVSLASMRQPASGRGRIVRSGPSWLFWLTLATGLAPFDLLSGAPGIVNFRAKSPGEP